LKSGASVASAGDVNGDGFDDLIVGRSLPTPGGRTQPGRRQLRDFGKAAGSAPRSTSPPSRPAPAASSSMANWQVTGRALGASAGDVNGGRLRRPDRRGALCRRPRGRTQQRRRQLRDLRLGHHRRSADEVTHPGTDANDTLVGDGAANVMVGGQGDDILEGNGGADVFHGGAGDDC